MFTPLHFFAAFPLFYVFRKKLNLLAFLLGTILPDLEGLYLLPETYKTCASFSGQRFITCAAEYPSHFLLHSFSGAILIGIIAVFIFKLFKSFECSEKIVFLSAIFGVLAHLFTDLFFHKGADALPLFYPAEWRFSLAFLHIQQAWYILSAFGSLLFVFYILSNYKKYGKNQKMF